MIVYLPQHNTVTNYSSIKDVFYIQTNLLLVWALQKCLFVCVKIKSFVCYVVLPVFTSSKLGQYFKIPRKSEIMKTFAGQLSTVMYICSYVYTYMDSYVI